jgi:hypothetical protein
MNLLSLLLEVELTVPESKNKEKILAKLTLFSTNFSKETALNNYQFVLGTI